VKRLFPLLLLFISIDCFAARPRYSKPQNPDQSWQNDLDLQSAITKSAKSASLAITSISTTTGYNTNAPHTKDWPTQVDCLGNFVLCVDTAPAPYGQRVMIGTSTSLRHAGLQVQYSVAFKPALFIDSLGVSGNEFQIRSDGNALWAETTEGWWQNNTVDTFTVILGAYQGAIYFYTKNRVIPILKLGNPLNDNIEFRNGSSLTFEIDSSSISANLSFYGKGTTSAATIPSGYIGEVISTQTLANINVGTSNQYFDIVSTGISAGHWMIGANATYSINGATFLNSVADLELGISQTAGNSAAGLTTGDNYNYSVSSANTNGTVPISIVNYELNIAAATTIYLKGLSGNYTVGRPVVRGRMTAIRLP